MLPSEFSIVELLLRVQRMGGGFQTVRGEIIIMIWLFFG